MKKLSSQELDSLIYAVIDGDIQTEEHEFLQQELIDNENARKRYIQLSNLENLMELESEQRTVVGNSAIIPMDRYIKRQQRQVAKISIFAAAAMLVFACLVLQFVKIQEPSPLATITSSPHSEFTLTHNSDLELKPTPGTLAEGSSLYLEQGTVELMLASGVRTIIQAPASITLLDESHLELYKGTAWFHVPQEAIGFEVLTSELRVIDLGTEFGVISGSNESAGDEVHVFKGKVEVINLLGKEMTEILTTGQARVTHHSGTIDETPLSLASFFTTLPSSIPYLHWSFDEVSKDGYPTTGNQPLVEEISSLPESPQVRQVSGKYGKAIHFTPHQGHLKTTWPGIDSDRPRTVSCWIKCPDHTPEGAIVEWGIPESKSSKWRISLNPDLRSEGGVKGALRTEFGEGYIIGSTDLRDGQWHHITSVYNGSGEGDETSIQLYVDGRLEQISAKQSNTIDTILDDPLSMPCRIGRTFNGSIDELRIYQGVLPPSAISRLPTSFSD